MASFIPGYENSALVCVGGIREKVFETGDWYIPGKPFAACWVRRVVLVNMAWVGSCHPGFARATRPKK